MSRPGCRSAQFVTSRGPSSVPALDPARPQALLLEGPTDFRILVTVRVSTLLGSRAPLRLSEYGLRGLLGGSKILLGFMKVKLF